MSAANTMGKKQSSGKKAGGVIGSNREDRTAATADRQARKAGLGPFDAATEVTREPQRGPRRKLQRRENLVGRRWRRGGRGVGRWGRKSPATGEKSTGDRIGGRPKHPSSDKATVREYPANDTPVGEAA